MTTFGDVAKLMDSVSQNVDLYGGNATFLDEYRHTMRDHPVRPSRNREDSKQNVPVGADPPEVFV